MSAWQEDQKTGGKYFLIFRSPFLDKSRMVSPEEWISFFNKWPVQSGQIMNYVERRASSLLSEKLVYFVIFTKLTLYYEEYNSTDGI